MSAAVPAPIRPRRRLPSRWPGRVMGALAGLTLGTGGLIWLASHHSAQRHQWGREEIDAKKAVAGLIGKIQLADRGTGIDAEKAKASGKALVHRDDALAVKDQLDRGVPRDKLRLAIQAEADITLAKQQQQLIGMDGFIQYLEGLQPKKDQIGPAEAKAWANPAQSPPARFTLAPAAVAADLPARAREAAEAGDQSTVLKKQLEDLKNLEGTARQREQALGLLLKEKPFQNLLPGFAKALQAVYDGTGEVDAVVNLARAELQSRKAALEKAAKATATLRKLGGAEDASLENQIKNRAELLAAIEGAHRAGDRALVSRYKDDPAFRQVAEFARAVDGDTKLLTTVRASDLPQKKRVELVDLLFSCEPKARWLVRWLDAGSPLPGDLPPPKPGEAKP